MKINWRLIIGGFLLIGFPAWIIYWVSSNNDLIYIYAVMGYISLAIYLVATGATYDKS